MATAAMVDDLRGAAALVIAGHGADHQDSSYALMAVAVAACEVAFSVGDLPEVDELIALMDAMVRKEAAFPHSRALYEWMQVSFLSCCAELAVARSDWLSLEEVANSLRGLADRWSDTGSSLFQVLQLDLANVNLELARERSAALGSATRDQAVAKAVRSLRSVVDSARARLGADDPRVSLAATSHAFAFADLAWHKTDSDLQQAVDVTESALELAISSLGREHPSAVILMRQAQALQDRLYGEDEAMGTAAAGSLAVATARTVTGSYGRGGYVSWAKAADNIRQEARRPRQARRNSRRSGVRGPATRDEQHASHLDAQGSG